MSNIVTWGEKFKDRAVYLILKLKHHLPTCQYLPAMLLFSNTFSLCFYPSLVYSDVIKLFHQFNESSFTIIYKTFIVLPKLAVQSRNFFVLFKRILSIFMFGYIPHEIVIRMVVALVNVYVTFHRLHIPYDIYYLSIFFIRSDKMYRENMV